MLASQAAVISSAGMVIEGLGFVVLTREVWQTHRDNTQRLGALVDQLERDPSGKVTGVRFDRLSQWSATPSDDPDEGRVTLEGRFFQTIARSVAELQSKAAGVKQTLIVGAVLTGVGLVMQIAGTILQAI